jgi:hypothetical protein
MVSTPQTLASYDKFLKEYYLSSWIDQLNSMSTTWALLRRKIVDFAGRRMIFPVRKSRNTGVGAVAISSPANAGAIPTLIEAGQQGIENGIVQPKLVMGALEIAQDVIDSSKNDRGAFFSAIDFEMAGLVQDVAEDLDRETYGNGSGTLARVTAAVTAASPANVPVSYHRPFFEGQKLDNWSTGLSGAALTNAGLVVISVQRNPDGSGVLSMNVGVNILDNSVLTRAGVRTATQGFEMMGLGGLIDSSNPPLEGALFQGVNRSGNTWWQSIEDTSTLLNETMIQTNLDNTHDDSNGDVNCLLMNRIVRRNLYDGLATDNPRRLVNSNLLMPGYISGKLEDHHPDAHDFLFFDGRVPIVVDKFCPVDIDTQGTVSKTGTVYGLDLSSIYTALVTDFKWWDGGQGTVLRPSTNRKFSLEAVLYIMGNMVTDAPRKSFKNESLTLS